MLLGLRQAEPGLGGAEREQQLRRRGRFRGRAAQQVERDVGVARAERARAGRGQHARRMRVLCGLGGQVVGGDHVLAHSGLRQQRGGAAVQRGALGGDDAGQRGLAHHRVREAQRVALEQVGVGQRGVCARHGGLVEPGQRARAGGADGRGAGERTRFERELGQPHPDHPRDRPGDGPPHGLGLLRTARQALGGERAAELAHEQRVAAGRLGRGGHERRVELAAEHAADGVRAERLRVEHGRPRERLEQRLLGRARGHDQRDRQLLEPAREHAEHAQAAGVAPVGVVDHDRQRLLLGQVGGQPDDAVQADVADVVAVRRLVGAVEHGGRELGRAGEQALTALGGGGAQLGLEELADEAEGEVALELGADGRQHAHAVGLGLQRLQQRGLAVARRRLDEGHAAGTAAGVFEQRAQRFQLRVALQQLHADDGTAPAVAAISEASFRDWGSVTSPAQV